MASEDTEELVPGFPSIHRLHDLNDLRKTSVRLVSTFSHQLDTERELLEVELLGRSKRILPEERNDPFEQILSTTNDVTVKVFPVVVMPPVHVHLPRSEELTQVVKTRDATGALRHHKIV